MMKKQRGISFLSLIVIGGLLAFLGVIGAQALPTVLEYQTVIKAVKKAASEGTTVPEVRAAFDRAAAIDDIRSISGKDLTIARENDQVVVSFAYEREIHIGGPVYLLFKYAGRS